MELKNLIITIHPTNETGQTLNPKTNSKLYKIHHPHSRI